MLQNFNSEKPVIFKTNTSDYIITNVFSQLNEKGNFYLIIFFFSKMFSEKYNYKIYDKELLIIIKAFKK